MRMRRRWAVLGLFLLLLAGCRGTQVNLFGVELDRVQATTSDLSTDEKIGVVVVLGVAVAVGVGVVAASD